MKTRKLDNGVIELLNEQDGKLGEFYREIDGYYVFEPNRERGGFYSEWYLQKLLELLTELNLEWDAKVSEGLRPAHK